MLSLAIWLAGTALLLVLLMRALRGGFIWKYPVFYAYLSFVLVKSACLLFTYLVEPNHYRSFYWHVELISAVLGCAVVWEIYRGALGRYPGAARMARNLLLVVIAMVFSKFLVDTWNGAAWWPAGAVLELERNLRAAQAVMLGGLVMVISVYRIPLGQNVWGMMLGYGLFISTNVITLALRVLLGDTFQDAWHYLQPLSYNAMLCIWCITLGSYKPVPIPKTEPSIEQDYQVLVAATSKGLAQARTYVRKAMRS